MSVVPENAPQRKAGRLTYLDWARGVAAITMLQGHVFHSFTHKDLRETSPYVLSQFVGGMPPAIFLFLTGVTFAFMMSSAERKGMTPWRRVRLALRRSGYLFGLALLFRLQLWVFGLPSSPWTDLLRVDILNCMGLALAASSVMAIFSTLERVRLCAALGMVIAVLSPLVSELNFDGVPGWIAAYIRPDYNYFSFFPWAAFVPFGLSFGSLLKVVPEERVERTIEWGAILGFGLVLGGQYFGNIPYSLYTKSEYWLNSPALVFVKLGIVLLLISFAYLWTEYALQGTAGWVVLFGQHSLLVYWVHTELVYGRWFWMWKESLPILPTAMAAAAVIASMAALSYWKARWQPAWALNKRRAVPRPSA